jgi:predicted ATPase
MADGGYITMEKTEMADRKSSVIRGIKITHGFLGGLDTPLSEHLNCVIGARGTGKTSLIEFIRYALDLMPSSEPERRRIMGIVEGNLAGGRIELSLTTCNGTDCTVSRTQGEPPMLLDGEGRPTGKAYLASLFGIDIFSQNEVERIADDIGSQLRLIDSFDQANLRDMDRAIADKEAELRENARKMVPLKREIAELEDAVSGLAAKEEQLKGFTNISGQDSKKMVKANSERAMREREAAVIPGMQEVFTKTVRGMKQLCRDMENSLAFYRLEEFDTSPNTALFDELGSHSAACRDEISGKIAAIVQYMREAWPEFENIQGRLTEAHQAQELEYNNLLEQSNADRAAIVERRRLERERDELRKKNALLEEKRSLLRQCQEERDDLTDGLSEKREQRFTARKNIVDRINAAVGPSVRVTLEPSSNSSLYRDALVNALRGSQMQYSAVVDKITEHVTPAELAGMLGRGNAGRDELIRATGINLRQADIVMNVFKAEEARLEIEMVDLPDLTTIELLDGSAYKATKDLSTGQKCNAILPILLLDSDRPLIIDQPEDNLDNAFIHSTVVRSVAAVKRRRQLLFVTHNPNIPVLGEAEQMLVLESNGTEGRLRNSGSIEHCKDDIVNLLEGGKEAFEKRKECYARIEKKKEAEDGGLFNF